jgi:AraC family transcriptional regulator of adaptative response/methylated-DNA-[protein]-cysteine methyltransferase
MTKSIQTPLGPMFAVVNGAALVRLSFEETSSSTEMLSIERELEQYFAGVLREFKTPIELVGTPFQLSVWKALQKVPYGETCSYRELAIAIGKPTAARAVAQALGANPLPILVPCHRVIASDGSLGGFSCGLRRKRWLLELEKII